MKPDHRLSIARWEADRHAAVAPYAVERIVAACEAEFLRTR